MNTFLVSYDLRRPGRNYQRLYYALASYSGWARPLESVWLIETVRTAQEVLDHLRQYIDPDDGIFVMTARTPAAWHGVNQEVSRNPAY